MLAHAQGSTVFVGLIVTLYVYTQTVILSRPGLTGMGELFRAAACSQSGCTPTWFPRLRVATAVSSRSRDAYEAGSRRIVAHLEVEVRDGERC